MIGRLLKGFLERDGMHMFLATIGGRGLAFLASWIALKLIPNYELGLVIYAQNIIAFLVPISGLGASQGLLRFGALSKDNSQKNALFGYVILWGLLISILLIVLVILLNPVLTNKVPESGPYLSLIAFQLITLFLLENLKTYFRIIHRNKIFAKIELSYSSALVILVFAGSYFFRETGYVLAMVLAPLLTFLLFIPHISFKFQQVFPLKISKKSFWNYSFFAALSNVASQLLIVLDIILIGNILKDPDAVTLYKYLAIIPFSLLFLPRILILTDFVNLTQRQNDKTYLYQYIRSYILSFSFISLVIILLGWVFSGPILSIFGTEFLPYKNVFRTLLIGISGILILRGLFGNLLSVIGKAHVNFWISILGILINLFLNYQLIPEYGIFGAAVTSAVIMWVTAIVSTLLFFFYYKKNLKNR